MDIERLREDLKDYYGTAMASGFPMVMMDLSEVEHASEEELVRKAIQNGMDLSKYLQFWGTMKIGTKYVV